MRHRKSFNHLGRQKGHRKAMLANMATSLILHKRIKTTTAKAKALRIYVEPLLTKSKDDSTHSRRVVFSYLQSKDAVTELFREVSPKIADRPGGYTRILKTGSRLGDNADMCVIELVDYNENLLTAKEDASAKSGRKRRRGGKKKPGEVQAGAADVEVSETPATDVTEEVAVEATQEPVADETEVVEAKEEKAVEETVAAEEEVKEVPEVKAEEKAEEEEKKDDSKKEE